MRRQCMHTLQKLNKSPDTCQMTHTVFHNWGAILPQKTCDKIEHEEIGTCVKIETRSSKEHHGSPYEQSVKSD